VFAAKPDRFATDASQGDFPISLNIDGIPLRDEAAPFPADHRPPMRPTGVKEVMTRRVERDQIGA